MGFSFWAKKICILRTPASTKATARLVAPDRSGWRKALGVDKVYDKVGNFGWRIYPQGPGPAPLLQSLQTLTLLGVMGATNPLQSATSRYNLQPRAAEG